jgi:hypothetical protein
LAIPAGFDLPTTHPLLLLVHEQRVQLALGQKLDKGEEKRRWRTIVDS